MKFSHFLGGGGGISLARSNYTSSTSWNTLYRIELQWPSLNRTTNNIIQSAAYINQKFLIPFHIENKQNTVVNRIIQLLLPLFCLLKVILLSGENLNKLRNKSETTPKTFRIDIQFIQCIFIDLYYKWWNSWQF